MIAVVRAFPDLFRVSVAGVLAYRAELAIWVLTATLPLINLALWNTVVADGAIAGFGPAEMARYFAATLVVRQLGASWLVWSLNFEIRSGALSPRLLKPMHPLWQHAIDMLVAMPIRGTVLAPILAALVWWKPALWSNPGAAALALFACSVFMAWLLNFLTQAVFGILSFWLDKTDGLFAVWFAVWMLATGYSAPLALFPVWMQQLGRWLPFRGMLATPVELLGGFLAPEDALFDLAIQLGWCAVLLAFVAALWRAGVRRYGAFGA